MKDTLKNSNDTTLLLASVGVGLALGIAIMLTDLALDNMLGL